MKQARRKQLAVAIGCMLLYSNWAPAVFAAGETADNAEIVEVEEIDVTDTRLKERQAMKKIEITSETIKEQGAENAAQVLEKQAGVVVSGNNAEGKAAVSIRGSDANNTKVFVDGVPLSPVGDGVVDLSSIPADSIEKIEVFKGAVPVQYGSDAAGGVIYITTKKGGERTADFSVSMGSWNTLRQAVSLSGGDQRSTYFFNFKHEMTDGYTRNSAKNATYYDGKLDLSLNAADSLSLFGSYAKKYEQLPDRYDANGVLITNPGSGMQVTNEQGETENERVGTSFWYQTAHLRLDPIENWHGGLVYNHRFSGDSDLRLTLYKSAETKYVGADRPDDETGNPLIGGQHAAGEVRGFQLEHTIKTSPVNTVLWGYNRELRKFNQENYWTQTWYEQIFDEEGNVTGYKSVPIPYSTLAQYNYDSYGYFFQDTLKLGKLTAALGYRHNVVKDSLALDANENSREKAGFEPFSNSSSRTFKDPVFGFSYAVTERTELHGSIGKSFRYPSPAEAAGFSTVSGSGSEAAIKPEETLNRELGVAYSAPAGLHLNVTYFYKTVSDKIQGKTVVGQTVYSNLSEDLTMKGFELEISKKFSDKLKAFAQYTYTSAKNPVVGRQINDQPEHKAALGMNYTSNRGLKAYLALNYLGSRFSDFSNGSGNNPNDPTQPPEFNSVKLPAYRTVDFMLTKEKGKGREVYVKINNLTDARYYTGAYLVAPGRYTEFGTSFKL